LIPEVTPESDSTGGEKKKKQKKVSSYLEFSIRKQKEKFFHII
jgi:hypothetical protein